MFYVGERVVCKNDIDGDIMSEYGAGHTCGLRRGHVYTVAAQRGEFVDLKELAVGGWFASRFERVVSRPTSIEIFKRMLVPNTGEPVGVE